VAIFLKEFGVSRLLKKKEYPQYHKKKVVAHPENELSVLYGHANEKERFLLDFFIGSMVRDHEAYGCCYFPTSRRTIAFAALLLQDARDGKAARIGVLDVGGATLEDVTAWSTWQDTAASHRGSGLQEEETQGNGGKAYMYRLFAGQARILGIRDRRRNCKGFDGELGNR